MIAPARSRAVLAVALLLAAAALVLGVSLRSGRPDAATSPSGVEPRSATAGESELQTQPLAGETAQVPPARREETKGLEAARRSIRKATLDVQVIALETGTPIEGAWVSLDSELVGEEGVKLLFAGRGETLVDDGRHVLRKTTPTDARGRATFEVVAGPDYRVHASGWKARAGDGSAAVPPLGPDEQRLVTISIPTRAIPVLGFVVDAKSGDPVAEAEIRMDPIQRSQITWAAKVRSGPGGAFELALPSWGENRWKIEVDHEGYATALREFAPEAGELDVRLTVPMYRGATVVARVVDAAGDPVAEVVLCLAGDPRGPLFATTGADGSCRITGLSSDATYGVELTQRGKLVKHLEDPLRLAPDEERRLDFVLGAGCRIEGVALDEGGAPAARVPVWLVPFRADETPADERWLIAADGALALRDHTDSQGRFAFEDVAPGEWWLGPAPPDGAGRPDPERCVPLARPLHLDEGQASVRQTLELRRGTWIVGTVVLGDGSGEEAIVSARDVRGALVAAARSGGDGSFALGPLLPGRFELEARTKDGALRSSPVTCAAGDEGVTLVLPSEAGR